MVPGRKFSISTSTRSANWRAMPRPLSVCRFSVMLFLFLPRLRHQNDVPLSSSSRQPRIGSPLPGGSTLITSAPKYPRTQPANGPAKSWPNSSTRTPSSGRALTGFDPESEAGMGHGSLARRVREFSPARG